jgi:hypothetical protein
VYSPAPPPSPIKGIPKILVVLRKYFIDVIAVFYNTQWNYSSFSRF